VGKGKGGVVQYDYGKIVQGQLFQQTGLLNKPPTLLRTAVNNLKAVHKRKGNQIHETTAEMLCRNRKLRREYGRPDYNLDRLYKSDFLHMPNSGESCSECGDDPSHLVGRLERGKDKDFVALHYGLIASANVLIKDAVTRDQIARGQNVLCFEIEAAGLINNLPCLVIHGVCDYFSIRLHQCGWRRKRKLWMC
jgi:hypothetical protein